MISESSIVSNINTENQLTQKYLFNTRLGIARFILDVSRRLQLNSETASLALFIMNCLCVRRCFLFENKLLLAAASILLAWKTKRPKGGMLDRLSNEIVKARGLIISEDNSKKVKREIAESEIKCLRSLNFEIVEKRPGDFACVYCTLLYPRNEQEMTSVTEKIICDSFLTFANNVFKEYVVALACVLMSAKLLGLPLFIDKTFTDIKNMRRIHKQNMTEEEFNNAIVLYDSCEVSEVVEIEGDFFDKLNIIKKLHPYLKADEFDKCLKMLTEFYIQMKDRLNKNEKDGK